MLADNAAFFDGDLRRLIVRDVRNTAFDALSTGSSVSLPVRVAPGQPLKITLAWADAPGAVNATFAPVNNLDLTVTSPPAWSTTATTSPRASPPPVGTPTA